MTSRFFVSLVAVLAPLSTAVAGELAGSPESMEEQHEIAVESDYSFLRKPADVEHLVELGRLVEVKPTAEYSLSDVSFPFARPEVLRFIQSVAADYHDEFGFKLVVTSLTRPKTLQPANAHDLSVHPAGMASDLRVPCDSTRRAWLEHRLLALEDSSAIDVTREHHPSHYHVAVFAEKYLPIAVAEDTARVERRVRNQLARFAAADARPTPAPTRQHLLLWSLMPLALAAPLVLALRKSAA
jgi:hypothetical protein